MIKAKNNIEGEMLIKSLVTSIKNQDWDTYKMLMSDDQKEFYEDYFSDEKNTDGIKQILNIDLDDIIELTKDEVSDELLYDEYPSLKKATSLESFLISVNCKVDKENAFFYNGINYFLIVLVQEADGEYKIAQFNRPSYQLLEKIVGKEIKDTDKGKKIALEVVKYAEKGILINGEGNFITDGYKVKRKDKRTGKVTDITEKEINKCNFVKSYSSNNYKDHPNLDAYFYYTVPSKITVRMNKTDNSKIVSVGLSSYIKNTLPNEWYSTWDASALKAGAYCVKGVAIYRSIKPVNVNYMVSQGTQFYEPNTAEKATNKAVNAISNKYMVDTSFCIFFPEYGAGDKGEAGKKGSGRLLQNGSQYLASKLGYSCDKILNYYYKNSSYSDGKIKYVTYGDV